jgi:uncharacterized protein YqgC (DUF456 family)
METFFLIIGALFILTGFLGSFLPILPGPPISYIGLLIMQFFGGYPYSWTFLIIWAIIVAGVTILDNVIPAWGTKQWGGTPYGITGSMVGLIVGLFFFPPLGIVVGPLIGAFLGELIGGQTSDRALKSAIGSFMGFLMGTLANVIVAAVIGYYYFIHI